MTSTDNEETANKLLIVGDGEVADALKAISHSLGWEPVVVNTLEETVAGVPKAESVVVLSHHGGLDGPALAAAVAHGTSYVGAMGSRATQSRRKHWMLDNGTSKELVDSIHGPAGIDIGAHTPAEIAVSIVAEIVAVRRGVIAGSLSRRPGPIHPDLPPGSAECPAG